MALLRKVGPILRAVAGGLVLAAMIGAPLAYGATTGPGERLLAVVLGVAFIAWLLSLLDGKTVFRVGWLEFALLYLLASGWWMALNAHRLYDPDYRSFFYLTSWWPSGPGAVDRLECGLEMKRITGLLAGFLVVRALAAEAEWRRHFCFALAGSGVVVAVVGLVLKLGGPGLMRLVWAPDEISPTEFAFFRYHANAGAFLNLCWPLALALMFSVSQPGRKMWVWAAAVLAMLVALQMNLSKGAIALAVLLLVLFGVFGARGWRANARREMATAIGALVGASLVITLCLAPLAPYPTAWKKWEQLPQPTERNGTIGYRLEVQRLAWRMVPDAGWFGFGPGTFEASVIDYQSTKAAYVPRFDEAHNDYLQTVLGWGIGGTVAWSFVLVGGLRRVWRRCGWREDGADRTEQWMWRAILVALFGVLLHATFDFPLEIDSIRLDVLVLLGLAWAAPTTGWSER
jgi:O-antigen ligase